LSTKKGKSVIEVVYGPGNNRRGNALENYAYTLFKKGFKIL